MVQLSDEDLWTVRERERQDLVRYARERLVRKLARHEGLDAHLLAKRSNLYEKARQLHPERWSGKCRDWSPAGPVLLNPTHVTPMDTALRADDDSAVA